jgi:hypothetical protein
MARTVRTLPAGYVLSAVVASRASAIGHAVPNHSLNATAMCRRDFPPPCTAHQLKHWIPEKAMSDEFTDQERRLIALYLRTRSGAWQAFSPDLECSRTRMQGTLQSLE